MLCSEGPRATTAHYGLCGKGSANPSHDVCDRRTSRSALRGTPLIKVSMSCPWPSVTFNSHIPARPGVLLFVFARVWAESERIVWPRLEHFSRASVGQAMDRTASWRTTDAALVCFNL